MSHTTVTASNDLFSWLNDQISPQFKANTPSSKGKSKTKFKPTLNQLKNGEANADFNSAFGIDLNPNPHSADTKPQPKESAFNIDLNPQPIPQNMTSTPSHFNLNTSTQSNPAHITDLDSLFNVDDNAPTFYFVDHTKSMDLNYLFAEDADTKTNTKDIHTDDHKDNDMIAGTDDEDENDVKYNPTHKSAKDKRSKHKLKTKDGFDTNIFKSILADNKRKNIIVSPFSISTAMTLAMAGAKGNTMTEMLNILHPTKQNKSRALKKTKRDMKHFADLYGKKSGYNAYIKIANKLFINKGYEILNKYIKKIGETQDNIDTIDVSRPSSAAKHINHWIARSTNNMITNIITPSGITANTRLLIANAIYFKAGFVTKFDAKNTESNTPFYKNNKRQNIASRIKMMNSEESRIFATKVKGVWDIIKLPYKQSVKQVSSLSLICIINNHSPRNKKELSIEEIMKKLKHGYPRKVDLYLPKFKYEYEMNAENVLQEMGINDAFDETKADFSDITGDRDLFISNVIHKAVVEVDENGTEAAAATVVRMKSKRLRARGSVEVPPIIKFDHPFTFYIYDDERDITIFSGRFVGKGK